MIIFKLHKRKMSRKSMGCHSIEGPKIKVLKKFFFTNLLLFFLPFRLYSTVPYSAPLPHSHIWIYSFYSLTFIQVLISEYIHFIHSHSSRFLFCSIFNYSFIYSVSSKSFFFFVNSFIHLFINSIIKPYINSFNIDFYFFYFLISFIISHFVYDFH